MTRSRPALAALLLCAASWCAQPNPILAQTKSTGLPQTRLETAFPPGAKAGTSVEVNVTGTNLDELKTLSFGHPGIRAEVVVPPAAPVDPKKPAKPKKEGAEPVPAFKVTVAADVPPGSYDLRAVAKLGLSNPRAFVVGDRPELLEKEPNNDLDAAQKIDSGSVVNGRFDQGTDVDYFAFPAKRGQRMLIHCAASSIDSKARPLVEVIGPDGLKLAQNRNYKGSDALADVTPLVDGEHVIRLSEFTYIGGGPHYFYRVAVTTAPWIDATFPPAIEPGKPTAVTLFGRNLPGGQPDPSTLIDGVTLERLTVTVTAPADVAAGRKLQFRGQLEPRQTVLDGFEYRIPGPGGISNPALIALSRETVVPENDANDSPETAMRIDGNSEVAARIDKRSDRDYFVVAMKKGDTKYVEVIGDRQGANSSFLVSVYPPTPIAAPEPKMPPGEKPKKPVKTMMADLSEDSTPDPFSRNQFYARSGDPAPFKLVAAVDGDYVVRVTTREANLTYGPRAAYRLRVAAPKPDFRLVAMPAAQNGPDSAQLRAGGREMFDVYCWRLDGFKEPVALSAEGLPPGVTAEPGQIVGTNQSHGVVVLASGSGTALASANLVIKGSAKVGGTELVREARPCSITWAVTAETIPTIARMDQGLFVESREAAPFSVTLDAANATLKPGEKLPLPLVLKQGDKLTIPAKVVRAADARGAVTLQQIVMGATAQNDPVTANNGQPMAPVAADKADASVVIDVKPTTPAGTYTFAVVGSMPIDDPMKKSKTPIVARYPSNPVTILVLPKELGKARIEGPNTPIVAGQQGEATVRFDRAGDFADALTVKVAFPPTVKGLSCADVTIPAGASEAKIVIKVAADATPGTVPNIPVTVTGVVMDKYPIAAEAKMNVAVVAPKKDEPKKK